MKKIDICEQVSPSVRDKYSIIGPRGPGFESNKASMEIFPFFVLENFLLLLHRAYGRFSIYELLRNGPMKEFNKLQTLSSKITSKQFD